MSFFFLLRINVFLLYTVHARVKIINHKLCLLIILELSDPTSLQSFLSAVNIIRNIRIVKYYLCYYLFALFSD